MARGKLTEEQAEQHPQRSVITRALGPEASVQVDIDIFPAKAGDLFLLCSDGLTSMVHEPKLRAAVRGRRLARELGKRADRRRQRRGRARQHHRRSSSASRRSSRARGQRGGRRRPRPRTTPPSTRRSRATPCPRRARASRARGRRDDDVPPSEVADTVEDDYRRSGTVALSAIRPGGEPPRAARGAAAAGAAASRPGSRPPHRSASRRRGRASRKRRRRVPVGLIVVLAIVALILAGGWMATRAVYFVGTDPRDDRTIAIFRGLPYDLPLGIELYERYAGSGVTIDDVPPRAALDLHRPQAALQATTPRTS